MCTVCVRVIITHPEIIQFIQSIWHLIILMPVRADVREGEDMAVDVSRLFDMFLDIPPTFWP